MTCEEVAKSFVQEYYEMFDDPSRRFTLAMLYKPETSFMTFEGIQVQGTLEIMEKLSSLTFRKINRIITSIDSQPIFDGGLLINVLGCLQCDEDQPRPFNQVFVLKFVGNSFYCANDIFRIGIHHTI